MPPEPGQERWSVLADGVFCPAAAAWGERGVSVFMRGASASAHHVAHAICTLGMAAY